MSYTELFKFNKKGNAEYHEDIKNAFRGAMAIWGILEKRHLPSLPKPLWAGNEQRDYWSRTTALSLGEKEDPMKAVWELFSSDKLTTDEKIVLGSTFDNVIVKKENLDKLISAFESFGEETSLKEQADSFKKLIDDPDCIAIGFNQTSVVGDTWINKGGYDEESEEYKAYNIKSMNDHWYLFESENL